MRKTTKARERKPAWLKTLCASGSMAGLHAVVCPACRQWVCECRDGVWERYDCNIVRGDDIAVAVILGRPLMRIVRVPGLGGFRLAAVCGVRGLDPKGEYLAFHDCGRGRISMTPYTPVKRSRRETVMRWPKVRPSVLSGDPWAAEPEV